MNKLNILFIFYMIIGILYVIIGISYVLSYKHNSQPFILALAGYISAMLSTIGYALNGGK